jgi:hypothetical protein
VGDEGRNDHGERWRLMMMMVVVEKDDDSSKRRKMTSGFH